MYTDKGHGMINYLNREEACSHSSEEFLKGFKAEHAEHDLTRALRF